MFFKVKNLSLICIVSYGVSLVNAAQVDPDPGAAGPANPVVLGEGRMPKTLEVLARRVVSRALFDQNEAQINGYFQAHVVPLVLRNEIKRQYYLLRGQHMPGITEAEAQEIYRFSIQELLDNGRLPAIVNNELDLRNRYIADLDGLAQIPQVNNLRNLNLSGNQITKIQPDTFQGLGNLRILDLFNNQITQIQPDAFRGLGNLQILNLGFNQITQIHPHAFQGLGNLEILILSFNQITQIHPNTFLGLGNLENLYLYDNRITQIQPDTFQGLNNLAGLYLSHNQITQIHPNAFQGLNNLQWLSLHENQIIPDQQAQLYMQIQSEVGRRTSILF